VHHRRSIRRHDEFAAIFQEVAVTTEADERRTGFRAGGSLRELDADLGLLAELPGNWRGHGFNVTARPDFQHGKPFFLELNATHETLDFNAITGDIPNRGSTQPDVFLHGVRYLQQVLDVVQDTGIHIEPGMWIHIPETQDPPLKENYVRQSTIPHGDSLLAQSTFFADLPGGPDIRPVNSLPFTDTIIPGLNDDPKNPVPDKDGYLDQYTKGVLPPAGLPVGLNGPAVIKDPTILLRQAIDAQVIKRTIVLSISTRDPGRLVNIPFIQTNANANVLDAIFWIEFVELPSGRTFIQLQYVQRVILDFLNIHWPHISVATLKRI
jgi:hypothetical protein